MIPEERLWPINSYWDYHCGRNEFNTLQKYFEAFRNRYGEVSDVETFAFKAQAANYEAIRAMFEAYRVNKPHTTGVIQWMLNSAWPEMFWQLYDWYLMPNGAFYGTKIAGEPAHLVYNYGDKNIYIVNGLLVSFENLTAEVRVLNLNSQIVYRKDICTGIGENISKKLLNMPRFNDITPVYFIDLKLKDDQGKILSDNFYWLSTREDVLDFNKSLWYWTPNKQFADFTSLDQLSTVDIHVAHQFIQQDHRIQINVSLDNPSDALAFFIELNVRTDRSQNSVLPIFWDDNYISLFPGEKKHISGWFDRDDLHGEKPVLCVQGWNVEKN